MAILYETLRVKTPVPEVKWTSSHAQTLNVEDRTLSIPPKTLIMPSYLYVHKRPSFWGPDANEWRPSRWIGKGDAKISPSGNTDSPGKGEEGEVLLWPPPKGNFLGWSLGARNCPGKRFSQVEWVAFLAAMFRDRKVELLRMGDETAEEARRRALDFIDSDSDYGGLLLQLMHPERVPLVWRARD